MLELRNVTRVYTSQSGPAVRALDNISLTFPEKGMVFIVGKSGCGKTTLINILSGIDFPTGGDVFEIFLTESLVTAMWNFFLSCVLTFGATLVANGIMKQQFHLLLEIAHFSVRQVVILFALSFGAALLSSYFPIRKISRKKPVDIIRNA